MSLNHPIGGAEPGALVELRTVEMSFNGVRALRDVSLVVPPATVIGLAGENGAGKSTLLNVVCGIYTPQSGETYYDGVLQTENSPVGARAAGIGRVAQELSLLPHLSVAENILLGKEPRRGPFIDRRRMTTLAQTALDQIGSQVSPAAMVRELSFADRQLVEIAKALVSEPRLLILDEPTSGLRAAEVERLLQTIRDLRASGRSVIFITHRLSEMFAVCDSITVLKDGQTVATRAVGEVTPDELVTLMVGRELASIYPPKPEENPAPSTDPLLEVRDFTVPGTPVAHVSLTVLPGEIVGLAGLAGNGQNELLEGITGVRRGHGTVQAGRRNGPFSHPRKALRAGVTFVPEDRKTQGLVLGFSIARNLTISTLGSVSRWGVLSAVRERVVAGDLVGRLAIRPSDQRLDVAGLSGGNQQKVVIGKTLNANPSVAVFADPTRGIDVGTKYEIYVLMRRLATEGKGVLLLSTDLSETIGVCDRVLVMAQGKIVGEFAGEELTEEAVTRASFSGGAEA